MNTHSSRRVLIVEDNANERESLAHLLQDASYEVSASETVEHALGYLEDPIDIVVSDLQLGDLSGIDLLKHWKSKRPETMFLIMTGAGSTQSAVDAIKAGAYHYMTKPLDVDALLVMLQNMVSHSEEARKNSMLQRRLDEKMGVSNIIGNSPRMQRVFDLIRRSSQAYSTVLVLGESGTGKELVAEAIHQNSPRRNGPFVAVNCAAMAPTLVESELFGHEKGAFTGAIDRRVGRFESAHGGTLFIDEIGEFDVSLQVKLLRVLESRAIFPVGGNKEIKVDTRVLAATSRNIHEMMAKGQFREDLYYRLNVITIELPPLRQRVEDIPLLVKRFMERVNAQNGTNVTAISPEVTDALQQYHWPGNVRELLNVVERMIVLTDKGMIEMEDLPAYISRKHESAAGADRSLAADGHELTASGASNGKSEHPYDGAEKMEKNNNADIQRMFERILANLSLDELENLAIVTALRRFHNNRTRAARALGISVRTLQRKIGMNHALNSPEWTPHAVAAGDHP